MHASLDRSQQPHAAGLLIVLFALAGAAFGTLVSPGPVVAPSGAPTPACTPPTESVQPTGSAAPSAPATPTPSPSIEPGPGPTSGPTLEPSPTPRATLAPTPRPSPARTPRPTPRATPRPTPRATQTAVPTPVPSSRLVRHGSRTGDMVALTFDMGGRVGDALSIMDWLVANDVHTSVFMTGAMADNQSTDAGRRVLAIIAANRDLFTLGNHSYSHCDFRTLTSAEIRDELDRTESAVAPYCGQPLRPFFRPPNGGYDADVLAAVGAAGYRYTVTRDVDTIDWRPIANDPAGPTADEIVDKVLGNVRGGSIVLMHLGGYETLDALPRIVDGLREAGYRLVTLDELL